MKIFLEGGGGYFYFHFLRFCVHAMLLSQLSVTLRSAVAVRITGAIIGGQMGGDKECPVSGVTMQLGQSLEEGCRKARLAMCPGGCGLVFGGQCHKALVDSAFFLSFFFFFLSFLPEGWM